MPTSPTALHHYITLGRSGLRVSPFCLGTMTFGTDWGWGTEPEDCYKIMDLFAERGGNFIDTANIYTKGHSEKIIGDHIGRHGARRDRTVIATKFLGNLFTGDPNGGGAGRKSLMNACEESLRRLQTDYIDLYWMHFWDRHTPIDETMRAMDDLVRAGKVRHIGFSDTPAWVCAQAQYECIFKHWTPAVALQIEYSLAQRTVEHELVPMAQALGMGITPWSPLKYGVLTGKHTKANMKDANRGGIEKHMTDRNLAIVDVLRTVADELGTTCARVALHWVQSRQGVSSTILGARTLEQLEDNLASLSLSLNDDQLARLDAVSATEAPFPQSFLPGLADNVQGGTMVNGIPSKPWALAPAGDQDRW